MTTENDVPNWKFWHPLSFWKVLGIFAIAQLIPTFIIVALREGAGIPVPMWIAGGLGGLLGVLTVNALVRKRLAEQAAQKDATE